MNFLFVDTCINIPNHSLCASSFFFLKQKGKRIENLRGWGERGYIDYSSDFGFPFFYIFLFLSYHKNFTPVLISLPANIRPHLLSSEREKRREESLKKNRFLIPRITNCIENFKDTNYC